MSNFQFPPVYSAVFDVETKSFTPVWREWFITLVKVINQSGGTSSGDHNLLTSLQGGSSALSQYYHLNSDQYTVFYGGASNQLLHGGAGLPTWGSLNLSTDSLAGTLPAAQFPALSGAVTTSAGSLVTTLATVVVAGTNTKITYNNKGLVTAGSAATLASSDYANQGTTTTVLHGNAAGNPSWAAVSLTADVSGTLPVANGGTGVTTSLGTGEGNVVLGSTSTFTPALNFGGGSTGITYSTQTGHYSQLGNLVFFAISIALTSIGSDTGEVTITGLPVSAARAAAFSLAPQNITYASTVIATVSVLTPTILNLYQSVSGSPHAALDDTNFSNTSSLIISGVYMVA